MNTLSCPRIAAPNAGVLSSRRTRVVTLAASGGGGSSGGGVGDAVYLGKAIAETVLDRVGGVISEGLAEAQKRDAERRKFFEEFEDEVRARARDAAQRAGGAGAPSSAFAPPAATGARSAAPRGPPARAVQAPEAVDELRAEVAGAKAKLHAIRQGKPQGGAGGPGAATAE